jgi:chromosome segregation ATPase
VTVDTYSTLDRVTREHLEEARRLRAHLEDAEQAHSLAVAELKADLTRARRETQEAIRRAEGLAADLAKTQAAVTARDATIERLSARKAKVEGALGELIRQVHEGSDREVYEAARAAEEALKQ